MIEGDAEGDLLLACRDFVSEILNYSQIQHAELVYYEDHDIMGAVEICSEPGPSTPTGQIN